jgi:hypothetical protein
MPAGPVVKGRSEVSFKAGSLLMTTFAFPSSVLFLYRVAENSSRNRISSVNRPAGIENPISG